MQESTPALHIANFHEREHELVAQERRVKADVARSDGQGALAQDTSVKSTVVLCCTNGAGTWETSSKLAP